MISSLLTRKMSSLFCSYSGGRIGSGRLIQQFLGGSVLPGFEKRASGIRELTGARGHAGNRTGCCGGPVHLAFFQRQFEVVQLRVGAARIIADRLLNACPVVGALLFGCEAEIVHQAPGRLRGTPLPVAIHQDFGFRVLTRLSQCIAEVELYGGFVRRQFDGTA